MLLNVGLQDAGEAVMCVGGWFLGGVLLEGCRGCIHGSVAVIHVIHRTLAVSGATFPCRAAAQGRRGVWRLKQQRPVQAEARNAAQQEVFTLRPTPQTL